MDVPPGKVARKALVYAILFLSALALAASPGLAQLPSPTVTFIPDMISANSSFVMKANPGSVTGPVRVTWIMYEANALGSLPYTDGMYACYFSDTDEESTCGPVPFRYSTAELGTEYSIEINVTDAQGSMGSLSMTKEVGGIIIEPEVTVNGSTLNMLVLVNKHVDYVSYKVFDSTFGQLTTQYANLERVEISPWYRGSVDVEPGVYYIAFKAESSGDFGGGIVRVDTAGGGTGYGGVLQADSIDMDVLFQAGSPPTLPSKRICSMDSLNTYTDVTVSLPQQFRSYISITPNNSTIRNGSCIYYTIGLSSVTSAMDITTTADILSNGTKKGEIPIRLNISYVGGSGLPDCSQLSDGSDCLGGICCSGTCQKKAECCADSDCTSGSCVSYRCSEAGPVDRYCTTGTCMTDVVSCPDGQEETGTCTSGGVPGICCAVAGECSGQADSTPCTGGVCCSGECVECCTDADCLEGYECDVFNECELKATPPPLEIDFVLIGLIAALAAAGGLAAWWFLKKRKKSPEEEFEEESKKEGDVFEEEEFY
jgi:hypothetical protein